MMAMSEAAEARAMNACRAWAEGRGYRVDLLKMEQPGNVATMVVTTPEGGRWLKIPISEGMAADPACDLIVSATLDFNAGRRWPGEVPVGP